MLLDAATPPENTPHCGSSDAARELEHMVRCWNRNLRTSRGPQDQGTVLTILTDCTPATLPELTTCLVQLPGPWGWAGTSSFLSVLGVGGWGQSARPSTLGEALGD